MISPLLKFVILFALICWAVCICIIVVKKIIKKHAKNKPANEPQRQSRRPRLFTFLVALASILIQVAAIVAIIGGEDILFGIFVFLIGVFPQYIIYFKRCGEKIRVAWVIGYILYVFAFVGASEAIFGGEFELIGVLVAYVILCISGALMTGRVSKHRSNGSPINQLIGGFIGIVISPFVVLVKTIAFWITHLLIGTFVAMGRSIVGKPLSDGYVAYEEDDDSDEIEEERYLDEIERQGKETINWAERYFTCKRLEVSTYTEGSVRVDKSVTSMYVEFDCNFKMTIYVSKIPSGFSVDDVVKKEKDAIEEYVKEYRDSMAEEITERLGDEWRGKVNANYQIVYE